MSEQTGSGTTAGSGTGGPVRRVERILVGTDLSGRSDRAVARGLELAAQHGAALTLVHVVDEDLPARILEDTVAAARRELADVVPADRASSVETRVVLGKGYRDLVPDDLPRPDLVVLGIHRNEGDRPVTGTTVERLLRRQGAPVLVVPTRVAGPYRKVMVAVDFSVHARFALRSALALAPGTDLDLVHAYHLPFEGLRHDRAGVRATRDAHDRSLTRLIEEELQALAGSATADGGSGGAIEPVLVDGEVCSALRSEVERRRPDLLVLGTHGRVGVARAVLGSVAAHFLTDPPCDVLAVKAW